MTFWRITVVLAVIAMVPAPRPATAQQRGAGTGQDQVKVDAATERMIDGALRYLANQQQPHGGWQSVGPNHQAAITAYVLMAFMSAGHLPNEGEYGRTVARGTEYLLQCVRPDGYISAPTGDANMYGHGIAAIALGELYGQTHDPAIRPRLASAIKLIVNTQNREGGWRYAPRVGDADISVTVLQVVALRVARNAGIDVPQETIDRAIAYVKNCYHEPSGGFTYQPRQTSPGMARTSAAIYSLQVCGLYDDPMVQRGAEFVMSRKKDQQWFTYGVFYAAPSLYMVGGEKWQRWYDEMRLLFQQNVRWEGNMAHWDRSLNSGGPNLSPVFHTAVYTMVLAMPYHYIPIYQR